LVEFELLGETEPVRVCAFYNMGSNPEMPHVGRHSRYFQAWTLANGEMPRQGQKMDAEVFLEEQIFEIEVDDCRKDFEERQKSEGEIYSRVIKITSATSPNKNHSTMNQLIKDQKSTKQPIKQSTNQVGQGHGKGKRTRSIKDSPKPGDGNANHKQT
jgi:hypothetical protein